MCLNGTALHNALIGAQCSEMVESFKRAHDLRPRETKRKLQTVWKLLIISALGGSNQLIIQDGQEDGVGRKVQTPIQPPGAGRCRASSGWGRGKKSEQAAEPMRMTARILGRADETDVFLFFFFHSIRCHLWLVRIDQPKP